MKLLGRISSCEEGRGISWLWGSEKKGVAISSSNNIRAVWEEYQMFKSGRVRTFRGNNSRLWNFIHPCFSWKRLRADGVPDLAERDQGGGQPHQILS